MGTGTARERAKNSPGRREVDVARTPAGSVDAVAVLLFVVVKLGGLTL